MISDARRAFEMEMTPDQLMAEAKAKKRFPGKRFRVEGTAAGNSQLLHLQTAKNTAAKYGGALVELIDERSWFAASAAGLPTCTRKACRAGVGQPCLDKGTPRRPHRNRLGLDEPATETAAEDLGACPESACPAGAGEPCISPKGKRRKPHKSRVKAAKAAAEAAKDGAA